MRVNGDTCINFPRSFTHFKYSDLNIEPATIKAGENVTVSVTVTNIGERDADEVREQSVLGYVWERTRKKNVSSTPLSWACPIQSTGNTSLYKVGW